MYTAIKIMYFSSNTFTRYISPSRIIAFILNNLKLETYGAFLSNEIGFVDELFDNEFVSSIGLYITLALSESRLPDVVEVSL